MINKTISIEIDSWKAELYLYLWENSKEMHMDQVRPMILVCPGGGYAMTSDREADAIAFRFLSMGYHTAVLRYSVAPARYPVALLQAASSVKLLREHAKEWYIDTDQIFIMGFSAGGHLAASLGVFWKEPFLAKKLDTSSLNIKPNGLLLGYPVITSGRFAEKGSIQNLLGDLSEKEKDKVSLENQVSIDTPKTFIWHTYDDSLVPVENSLLFIQALRQAGVPAELHMFQKGMHGLALANQVTMGNDGYGIQKECEVWPELAKAWIESNK